MEPSAGASVPFRTKVAAWDNYSLVKSQPLTSHLYKKSTNMKLCWLRVVLFWWNSHHYIHQVILHICLLNDLFDTNCTMRRLYYHSTTTKPFYQVFGACICCHPYVKKYFLKWHQNSDLYYSQDKLRIYFNMHQIILQKDVCQGQFRNVSCVHTHTTLPTHPPTHTHTYTHRCTQKYTCTYTYT